MMHHTRRWNRDHSDELQSAWLNGCGVLVWESVFGVWVGWNAATARCCGRCGRLQRECPRALRRRHVDAAR